MNCTITHDVIQCVSQPFFMFKTFTKSHTWLNVFFSVVTQQLIFSNFLLLETFNFNFKSSKQFCIQNTCSRFGRERKLFQQFSLIMVFSRKSPRNFLAFIFILYDWNNSWLFRFYSLIFHIHRSSSVCSAAKMVYTLLIYSFIFTFISQTAFNTLENWTRNNFWALK